MSFSIKEVSINGLESGAVIDDLYPMLHLRTEGIPDQIRTQIFSASVCLFDGGKKPFCSPFIPLRPLSAS